MRMRTLALPLAFGLATAISAGSPASADTQGNTPVTFQVTGGPLNITVPTGPVDLGSVTASPTAQTVSAQLGTVTVTDDRDGTADWTVTAEGVDFTGPQNVSVSAPGSGSYEPGAITTTGTVQAAGSALAPLYPPAPVVRATNVDGINSASWNPTITVTVPAGALTGTYSSTITHSVN